MGPEVFLELLGVSGLRPCIKPTKERLCATLIRLVGCMTNTNFLPAVKPDSFGPTLLSTVLALLFCIVVVCIQYTCSTNFSSSVYSFSPLTDHYTLKQ